GCRPRRAAPRSATRAATSSATWTGRTAAPTPPPAWRCWSPRRRCAGVSRHPPDEQLHGGVRTGAVAGGEQVEQQAAHGREPQPRGGGRVVGRPAPADEERGELVEPGRHHPL